MIVAILGASPVGGFGHFGVLGWVETYDTYGLTVVLFLAVRRRLDRRAGAFDLGRFELPVSISALVWSVVVLFALVTPAASAVPIVIVAGALAVGGVYFVALLIVNRTALETEPGDVNAFR